MKTLSLTKALLLLSLSTRSSPAPTLLLPLFETQGAPSSTASSSNSGLGLLSSWFFPSNREASSSSITTSSTSLVKEAKESSNNSSSSSNGNVLSLWMMPPSREQHQHHQASLSSSEGLTPQEETSVLSTLGLSSLPGSGEIQDRLEGASDELKRRLQVKWKFNNVAAQRALCSGR